MTVGRILAGMLLAAAAGSAAALPVAPGEDVQAAIAAAEPGGTVELLAGLHRGSVQLDRAVTLVGQDGAVLDAGGHGSVVSVTAEGVVVRNLILRGSGSDLPGMDSAVYLERTATGARVEGNRMEGNLIGVYVHGAANAVVRANTIIGRRGGRTSEHGNGVSVWNAPGARVEDNDIRYGRDGVFVTASRRNVFAGNRFRDLRFAVHYMYADDSEVRGNASLRNHVGFAVMYSTQVRIRANLSEGDRDYGLLFNFANRSEIEDNDVRGRPATRGGPDTADDEDGDHAAFAGGEAHDAWPAKCVFIYNSNRNRFVGNRFEGCGIGVHFTAGSEGNVITGNAFIGNRTQVKYVGTRYLDWSRDGRGNYWSDNPSFDLDRDGISDAAYRPNDLVDRVLWTAPRAKILLNSPAVQVLRWAQSQFPAILPGGVVDSHPLAVAPPPPPAAPNWRP